MSRVLSKVSQSRLKTCYPPLRVLVEKVVKDGPFEKLLVIEGVRTLETQAAYVAKGVSRTMNSKHLPDKDGLSHAIDIGILLPDGQVNWGKTEADKRAYYVLAGAMYTAARQLGIGIRFGGNWDSDEDYGDQTFLDLFHYELL